VILVAGLWSLVVVDPLPSQATLPAMGGYMTDCGAVNFRRVAMVLHKLAEVEPWILKDRRARHEKEHQREQERATATGGKVL
jgi:5'-3' exonuclease